MPTLREDIKAIIELRQADPEQGAIEICKLLEDRIGLAGNGWFDNDPVMMQALNME